MPTDAEKRFIDAWRYAAPRLEAIRRRELQQLDESAGLRMIGANVNPRSATSGLIEFQSWMMRMRVKELENQRGRGESAAERPK